MSSIRPIIRKNLIYAKRNSFKSILQLFYPCIFLAVFIYITKTDKEDSSQPAITHYDQVNIFNIKNIESYQYDKIISQWEDMSYAIIGADDKINKDLEEFLIKTAGKFHC